MELINKSKFATITLDENVKTFVVYIATLSAALAMQIHPSYQAQIGLLFADKTLIKVLFKYFDYADVFSFNLVIELPENMGMNEHTIELINRK